ncbi:hypothetical protein [uncultured Thiocystis sp.]|jgi:hypothetical protein|uniref:hypothetical protein n=1 Tax=uncultured Thiocystis sp. TaxID=1202134 RepID=UPI0025DBF69A|nr:hypothetical protein [uncultured Thiocystis sp.]
MPHDDDPFTQARARLQTLAQHPPRRSAAQSLRALLPDIEAAQRAGASSTDILAELAAAGIAIAPRTFAKTLSRIRQERRAGVPVATPAPMAASVATPAPQVSPTLAIPRSNPASYQEFKHRTFEFDPLKTFEGKAAPTDFERPLNLMGGSPMFPRSVRWRDGQSIRPRSRYRDGHPHHATEQVNDIARTIRLDPAGLVARHRGPRHDLRCTTGKRGSVCCTIGARQAKPGRNRRCPLKTEAVTLRLTPTPRAFSSPSRQAGAFQPVELAGDDHSR